MNELSVTNQELIDQANQMMPSSDGFRRRVFPRIAFQTQDKTEGKGKSMVVVAEAGMFATEVETTDIDENGKTIWEKTDLGKTFEGTVVYYRKKLSKYDEATKKYTSSPLYDEETDMITLFCDKKRVASGTPKELKDLYMFTDKEGKRKCSLQEMRVLYVLYGGEIYELTVKGTSMYSFLDYTRKCNPSVFRCEFGSKERENGATNWSEVTFRNVRQLDMEELQTVVSIQRDMKDGIAAEKAYFASRNQKNEEPSHVETMDETMAALELPKVQVDF
jgi:hypothetical protein